MLVWLIDEQVWGRATMGLGAFYTMVAYTFNGIDYEVWVENEDFVTEDELLDSDNY